MDLEMKQEHLMNLLKSLDSVVVAFSGGVDSTFLAAAAYRALGDKAVAVTAVSETLPESERLDAKKYSSQIGIRHLFLEASELASAAFVANTPDRCYHCKKERFGVLSRWAADNGFLWVLEGSNADDSGDFRPGMRAVAEMVGVRSPLLEVGMTKTEIREMAHAWNLPAWNKLSAACLSSRLVYGLPVTPARLRQVEAAEAYLHTLADGQIRVRHHGDLARIEVESNLIPCMAKPDTAAAITAKLKEIGFTFVALDLGGYRMGSLNEAIGVAPKEQGK